MSETPKQKVARMPNRRYAYFRDDQITFLVAHQADTVSGDQLKEFVKEIEKHLDGRTIAWPPQIFSFPALRADEYKQWLDQLERLKSALQDEYDPSNYEPEPLMSAFSIIVCNVENALDPDKLIDLVRRLGEELRKQPVAGLTVPAVSPNWLMSAASDTSGTGGPGGRPEPFTDDLKQPPYRFADLIASLDGKNSRGVKLYGDGTGVDVAILDTAPCGHDLVLAHKELKSHPLIKDLLGPGGRLRLYPATYEELLRMGNTSLNKHDYKMTDHGLFVAGIVHSIVPQATIHLIEVLNAFGVGDLATLAEGLKKVFRDIYKPETRQPLVVNCSWMLELPITDKHCYAKRDGRDGSPDDEFEQAVLKLVRDDQKQALALKAMCDRFGIVGRQVIAAAGNDGGHTEGQEDAMRAETMKGRKEDAPEARYPAAFNMVVGVGALPKDSKPKPENPTDKYEASTYSNLGDKPAMRGVMALGGERGETHGVLGLYLGEFPPPQDETTSSETTPGKTKSGPKNENGWAWWAGTSFATPILTGAIAAVLSGPTKPSTTQDAVIALYRAGIIEDKKTDAEEDVMPSTLVQSVKPLT